MSYFSFYEVNQENPERVELIEYLKKTLGHTYNANKVESQISEYCKNGWSYRKILEVAQYWFDTKNGDVSKSNGGIGILQHIEGEYLIEKEQEELRVKRMKQIADNVRKKQESDGDNVKKYVYTPRPVSAPKNVHIIPLD